LGNSRHFYRSDPYNPYHDYIEQVYGTKVVTSSVHINIGIEDPEALMQACRLARVEAPLYLALSASSPFLDGQITGSHSTRWQLFPQTPHHVPLFASHSHYVKWTEEQLVLGTMQNVRHLWTSVRPNGNNRPYNLNRLELRVCDLVTNPLTLLGIVALLEARLTQLTNSPQLDPLLGSRFSEAELLEITTANEQAAARFSLDATLTHWQDGRTLLARDWIDELYQEVIPLAQTGGYSNFLSSVQEILSHGNKAQQWLKDYESGMDIKSIIRQSIPYAQQQELDLEKHLCQPSLVA
jgi:predicted glutamate--cysteine ligase